MDEPRARTGKKRKDNRNQTERTDFRLRVANNMTSVCQCVCVCEKKMEMMTAEL